MAGLKKYAEWMSRGRKTGRVAYVLDEWKLPEPKAGAEWAADNAFNAADELLRDPAMRSKRLRDDAVADATAVSFRPSLHQRRKARVEQVNFRFDASLGQLWLDGRCWQGRLTNRLDR